MTALQRIENDDKVGLPASEWVQDYWKHDYEGAPTDGSAWTSEDEERVLRRGGSWLNTPNSLRSAVRFFASPDHRSFGNGFRVARDL